MHLASGAVSTRQMIQRCWARFTNAVTRALFLSSYAIVLQQLFAHQPVLCAALQRCVNLQVRQTAQFVQSINFCRRFNHLLYDIPDSEWNYKRQFRPRQHLRIGSIPDDMTATKMTAYNVSQLRRLYAMFVLDEYCAAHHETEIRIATGAVTPAGVRKCYVFHPEELFLYVLTRIKTGKTDEQLCDDYFGGDYSRWCLGYRWLILYLDERYKDIIGLQGILRFLPDFMRFGDATERFCQKDRVYFDTTATKQ